MKTLHPDVANLKQNGITRLASKRLGDPSVIPLWFGEGDIVTADFIRDAAKNALDDGGTFYTYARGMQPLRDAIKIYLDNLYDVDINPDRISVPGSSMMCITLAAQMALSAGDEALIVSPHWPNIENTYRIAGAKVNIVRQHETASGWQLDADNIINAITTRTRSIFINSPCNPTGWVMKREDQEQVLAYCRKKDIQIIADEVYHRHVYDRVAAPSFLQIAEDDDPVVVVNGFSKAWAMTGWRVGWVVAPAAHATHWALMSECFNTGSTVFTQPACIAALEQGEAFLNQLKTQYSKNRRMVLDTFRDHPLMELATPTGAFYAFVRVNGMTDSYAFAEQLLAEEDVGVAPGYTFGPENEGYIRLCFALRPPRLQEGLRRLVKFVERHAGEPNEPF